MHSLIYEFENIKVGQMVYGINDFLSLIGGLAIFIYGMKMMSEGIQKVAGNSLRNILNKITDNKFSGLFVGFSLTTLVQSSSASTVMVVSFVNAGLIKVRQAIGIIMGANIGTTTTLWLVSLLGFSKFSISSMALPAAAIGVPLLLFGKRRYKYIGEFILGFGFLFYGLDLLKNGVPDYSNNPESLFFLDFFNDLGFISVLIFVLIGTLMTIIVQSSSAASAITIALVFQGVINFEQGAAMVLGENIGTTVTAYLAALVGNINAKRAARAHLIFNVIGVMWMLLIFYWFLDLVEYININVMGSEVSVIHGDLSLISKDSRKYPLAIFHTGFNIINSLLLIWFIPQIEKIVLKLLPDNKAESRLKLIGNKIIETPELAILEAKNELKKMGDVCVNCVKDLKIMLNADNKESSKILEKLHENENLTDEIEIEISDFLIEVAQQNSSEYTSRKIISMISVADELESIGDISYKVGLLFDRKKEQNLKFSSKMEKGLTELLELLVQASNIMQQNLSLNIDDVNNFEAEKVEEEINSLYRELKIQNLKRLEKKEDKLHSTILFREIYTHLEKIGDKIYQISKTISQQ